MKGLLNFLPDIVGYIVTLAVFVAGMLIIGHYWFQFQTIPKESPENTTACDLAYVLSIWEEATTYPNIFNKTYLDSWSSYRLGSSIFENGTSKFFLPDSDLFFKIRTKDAFYEIYVPPESKTTFDTCGAPYMTPESFYEANKFGIEEFFKEFGEERKEKEYLEKIAKYSEISSICYLPTFVADRNKVEIGGMVAGITTNLATKIREGIYQVSYLDKEEPYFYPLGSYPKGCLITEGIIKVEKKSESTEKENWLWAAIDTFVNTILDLWNNFWGWFDTNVGSIAPKFPVIKANCGFDWTWENQSDKFILNITTYKPGALGIINPSECRYVTRIPKKIVDEVNLSKKLCKPKKVIIPVWLPEGGLWQSKKYFFIKINKFSKDPQKKIDFCKSRCNTELPFDLFDTTTNLCKSFCTCNSREISECVGKDSVLDLNCSEYLKQSVIPSSPYATDRFTYYLLCRFAQNQIYLYQNLPEGAIDIQYVVVSEDKLNKNSVEQLDESDYYDYESACSTWPGIFECTTARDCAPWFYCIDKAGGPGNKFCGVCLSSDLNRVCSPNYLKNPPSILDEMYYTCQNVTEYRFPLTFTDINKCLPLVEIKVVNESGNLIQDQDSDNILDFGCSSNEKIEWIINASKLCCKKINTTSGECILTTGYCPKIKFYSSLNTTNVFYLNKNLKKEMYAGSIKQQVCRDGIPYNNAENVFIVATYYIGNSEFKYIPYNTTVKLT